MTTPRRNAEVIKAWADGAEVQYQKGDGTWVDSLNPAFYAESSVFRVKPAAPKWPQTTMTSEQMLIAQAGLLGMAEQNRALANVAIAHACETGQVVPADKVREIEAKARAEGAKEGRCQQWDRKNFVAYPTMVPK